MHNGSKVFFCPICGAEGRNIHSHLLNKGHRVTVAYCKACCYYWIDPEELTINSDCDYLELLKSVKTVRDINNKRILKKLESILSDRHNVKGLEVGSGNGSFLKSASEYDRFHFIGIEPMLESYKLCREQRLDCLLGSFPDDLPTELSEFDIIIFNDVFEHIPSSAKLIQKCKELLNKDGLLVINCPVNSGIFFRLGKTLDRIGLSEAFKRLWQLNENPNPPAMLGRLEENVLGMRK